VPGSSGWQDSLRPSMALSPAWAGSHKLMVFEILQTSLECLELLTRA